MTSTLPRILARPPAPGVGGLDPETHQWLVLLQQEMDDLSSRFKINLRRRPYYCGRGKDDTAMIQNALADIADKGRGVLYAEGGTTPFLYSQTMYLPPVPMIVQGDGYASCFQRVASIAGETGERPDYGGVPSHFIPFYLLSEYRSHLGPLPASNQNTAWATPEPDDSYISAQHRGVVFRDVRIRGTKGMAGTPSVTNSLHCIRAEGVDRFSLIRCFLEDCHDDAVSLLGSGATDADGAGRTALLIGNVLRNVLMGFQAQELWDGITCFGNTAIDQIGDYCVRWANCTNTRTIGNQFTSGYEPAYFSVQGLHELIGNILDVTTADERVVRVDGEDPTETITQRIHVLIEGNTIKRGGIGYAVAPDATHRIGKVTIRGNDFLNLDGRSGNGGTINSFKSAYTASLFIAFGNIENDGGVLDIDQVLPTATDNSTHARYRYTTGPTIECSNSTLTIASGAITVTGKFHYVTTEGAAATDDLDTINGGKLGEVLVLSAEDSTHTVVLKDGTGNLRLAGDVTLDNAEDKVMLVCMGATWHQVAMSDNGA